MGRVTALSISLLASVLLIVGCPARQPAPPSAAPGPAPKGPEPPGTSALSGKLQISGAFALYPMVVKWAEVFQQQNPGVKIDVSAGGAGKGATDALGGLVDIGMVSRAIHEDEIAKGAWWVPACIDAVFPTINEQNPILARLQETGVQADTLAGIWLTQTVTTWNEVVNATGGERIHVYTRSDACGAAETWAKFLGEKQQEDLKGTAVFGDPGLAEAVRKDPLAIGFNNLNYAYDAATGEPVAGLRIAPLDTNGNGRLDPDESFYTCRTDVLEAIQAGRYPSPPARELNLLCKGAPTGVTAAFIRYCLTAGQEELPANGYIPLPADTLAEAVRKLG